MFNTTYNSIPLSFNARGFFGAKRLAAKKSLDGKLSTDLTALSYAPADQTVNGSIDRESKHSIVDKKPEIPTPRNKIEEFNEAVDELGNMFTNFITKLNEDSAFLQKSATSLENICKKFKDTMFSLSANIEKNCTTLSDSLDKSIHNITNLIQSESWANEFETNNDPQLDREFDY